ncbi:MAG: riboflavin biosynthesis protein RibF [Blautia sp.]|nr:riboflavin biosynthesis protein RibF [Blautia sp.]
MEYFKIKGEYPHLSGTALTLGKFDGIHRGHQKLVSHVLEKKQEGKKAVLFSIEASDRLILSHEERAAMLEDMGLDVLIECPLDDKFRRMKADVFVREILVGDLGAECVTVGEDFRFGFERKGNPELLLRLGAKYGFQTIVVPRMMDAHRKISSTYIREELKRGNMEKVGQLMGACFYATGKVTHGMGLGHRRLLPTINLIPPAEKLMPPHGVYFTRTWIAGRTYEGITNVGIKPTVGENMVGIETYLFDCKEDLYGLPCKVEFLHFSRREERFDSLDALRCQLFEDVRAGRLYFE